jgi:hypothetical protein
LEKQKDQETKSKQQKKLKNSTKDNDPGLPSAEAETKVLCRRTLSYLPTDI